MLVTTSVEQRSRFSATRGGKCWPSAQSCTQALEKRLAQLSDQLARQEREFTDRLSHEVQVLRDEMRKRQDDARATTERMFAELSNVKTDRNLLAGLFVEIAKCLNQDVAPKGSNGHAG